MTRVARVGDAGVPPVLEGELQAAVIELGRSLGWGTSIQAAKALALEAAQYGVAAPPLDGLIFHPRYSVGSEPGWPDLTLLRRRDRRIIFAELKSATGVLSARQREVMGLLGAIAGDAAQLDLPMDDRLALGAAVWAVPIQTFVWRPADLVSGAIAKVLR